MKEFHTSRNLLVAGICMTINCLILTGCIVYLGTMTKTQNDSLKRITELCRDIKACH